MRSPECRLTHMCLCLLALSAFMSLASATKRRKDKAGKDCERGTHSCHKDAICLSSRRSYKCRCKEGFYGNGKICVDEDECEFENGGCAHSCQNSPGNYSCSCRLGFELAPDGHNCIDINECFEERGGCAHQCVNTVGTFQCKCNAGYGLQSDGKTCKLGIWCQNMLGCSHHCKSTSHGPTCACREGYRIHSDGKTCIQTCAVGNGGCQHNCQDTSDGPVCSCAPKYILQDNKKTCIASCGVNRGGCERKCLDTKAGPQCSCPRGYELHQDGKSCLDINECDLKNGFCSHICVNTHGSYECVCPSGFKVNADQRSCQDIDECLVNRSCDHMCVNTLGSFQCHCKTGFQNYGQTHCADINECSVNNGGCEHLCYNIEGSFYCACRSGFKLHPNQKDCISINTCAPLKVPAKATMTCQNTGGGERQCVIACNSHARFSVPVKHQQYELTCGPSSGYKWTFEKDNITFPMCSEKIFPPSFKRKATFVFVMDKKCHFHKTAVQHLVSNLTQVLNEQKKFKCTKKCHVNYMDMKCGSRRKKFQRHVRGTHKTLITAEFELQMNPKKPSEHCNSECMSKRTQRKLRKAFRSLKRSIKREKFYVKFEGNKYEVLKRSFKPEKAIEVACRPGNVLIKKMCVACSIGSYFSNVSEKCELCEGGTYQDQEGKLSCKACPNKTQGVGIIGAKSPAECSDVCNPGYFSENGSKPCHPCGIGSYQPEYGRTSCIPCGAGMRTRTLATTNFKGCAMSEMCLPGHYYSVKQHHCLKCPIGTYQSKSGYNFCTACPGDTTTDQDTSTNSQDCKDRHCRWYQGRYQGVIETPNYPGNYPVNMKCTWKIKPEKRRRILIIIPEIYLREDDKCGDVLVMRKSKSPYSLTTFETCKSRDKPIAFTARSKKLWIQFKSDANNTAAGFSIPFVTYNEEYQSLIDDIVSDGRLYNSYHQQQIFKDRRLLDVLLEVIAEPPAYFKYANVSHRMFPESFFKLLTPKVRRFFAT